MDERCRDDIELNTVAGRILDSLRHPFFVNERELHKTAMAADQHKASRD